MSPTTLQMILELIPSLVNLAEQITNNIELANSVGVTEVQLQQLVTATSRLTTFTTTALLTAMNNIKNANATAETPAAQ